MTKIISIISNGVRVDIPVKVFVSKLDKDTQAMLNGEKPKSQEIKKTK